MSRSNVITIEHLEVKKTFNIKDNAEAVKKSLDVATGKIELESIFEKHKGAGIEKVYA